MATAGLAIAGCRQAAPPAPTNTTPGLPAAAGNARIAIVGGGMAGLNTAYKLQKAGLRATIYEGADRTGGRIFTATNLLGDGLTTELGGEFIDSTHEEMLALMDEFGLERLDTLELLVERVRVLEVELAAERDLHGVVLQAGDGEGQTPHCEYLPNGSHADSTPSARQ